MSVKPEMLALVQTLVGRTILNAECFDASDGGRTEWTGHEELTLTLDDGRRINIFGWGYDAWGIDMAEL